MEWRFRIAESFSSSFQDDCHGSNLETLQTTSDSEWLKAVISDSQPRWPPWHSLTYLSLIQASVAQLDAPSDWRPGGRGFNPRRGRQHSFVEIDHEIFSTVILSLPLIQEGQLSVSGERMCTILVNRLED